MSGDRRPFAARARDLRHRGATSERYTVVTRESWGIESQKESAMQNGFVQYGLMVVFFGVIAAIPSGWYLLGIKTYGTGDYYQP